MFDFNFFFIFFIYCRCYIIAIDITITTLARLNLFVCLFFKIVAGNNMNCGDILGRNTPRQDGECERGDTHTPPVYSDVLQVLSVIRRLLMCLQPRLHVTYVQCILLALHKCNKTTFSLD